MFLRGALRALGLTALALLISACGSREPLPDTPASAQTRATTDAQACTERAQCTLKVSRTLLFVFDYASAGAPLVERQGRRLFTPLEAPVSAWPQIMIELAPAQAGVFGFASYCRQAACRFSDQQLLQLYRHYLRGGRCAAFSVACLNR